METYIISICAVVITIVFSGLAYIHNRRQTRNTINFQCILLRDKYVKKFRSLFYIEPTKRPCEEKKCMHIDDRLALYKAINNLKKEWNEVGGKDENFPNQDILKALKMIIDIYPENLKKSEYISTTVLDQIKGTKC